MWTKAITVTIAFALCLCASTGLALDVNFGNWEHTIKMEAKGMPFAPAPITSTACLTKEDITPKAVSDGDQKCTMLESKESGNTVSWYMECTSEAGKSTSKGEITYKGDSYNGTVEMATNGMKMNSKLSGKRLGDCK